MLNGTCLLKFVWGFSNLERGLLGFNVNGLEYRVSVSNDDKTINHFINRLSCRFPFRKQGNKVFINLYPEYNETVYNVWIESYRGV